MDNEINDHIKLNTWTLVDRPSPSTPIISGKWVYKLKTNPDKSINKYKARWVARGFEQEYGVNYIETFANTCRPEITRLLFAIATIVGFIINQWDIKLAFVNSPIDVRIYVEQPHGYKNNSKVCLLNKALYGLKQSARQWQLYLAKILAKYNFYPIQIDQAVYLNKEENTIIITHVDNFLIFSSTQEKIDALYSKISLDLEINNLGLASYFLGVEIIRNLDKGYTFIHQTAFINRLLDKFNKSDIKPKSIPLPIGLKLIKNDELASAKDIKKYQQEIGSLIYLTTYTRPNIAQAVNLCARFMSNPSYNHFKALDNIWGYLNNFKDLGLLYKNQPGSAKPINFIGYSDSDWGGDYVNRKSTTGWLFIANNTIIAWNSKLQKTVALSSCEAEYMALKETTKQSLYFRSIIRQIPIIEDNLNMAKSNQIYTDSNSAIELAKNPVFHSRTKHIDIQYHFIREHISNKNINLIFCPTNEQLADSLTKIIDKVKFSNFIKSIGLVSSKTLKDI